MDIKRYQYQDQQQQQQCQGGDELRNSNNIINFVTQQNNAFNKINCPILKNIANHNTHNKQISSYLAYPELNYFNSSIQVVLKILKATPNWIGIGVWIDNPSNNKYNNINTQLPNQSLKQHQTKNINNNFGNNHNNKPQPYTYSQQSPNHITLLSNGWLNNKGELTKITQPQMVFNAGDRIKLTWLKHQRLLIFEKPPFINTSISKNNQRCKVTVRFQPEWNQNIYLCISLYHNGDTIQLISSGQLPSQQ